MRPLLPLVALLLPACAPQEPPKPKETAKSASNCDVTTDTLVGTTWVHLKPQPNGPDKPNPVTRIRFRDNGGKITADYTASSLSMVYQYDCEKSGNLLSCFEHDPHYKEWCRAWAASHDGVCDPVQLAAKIGAKPEDLADAVKTVNEEFKAAKGDERAQMMKDYNSPNNKIRGKIRAALNTGTCQITVEDKFQAMFNGQIQEYENAVSNSKFTRTKDAYTFEKCEDLEAAHAVVPEGATARSYPAGSYTFESGLPADQKAAGGCTYAADIWYDWLLMRPGLEGKVDGAKVKWELTVPLAGTGPHVVYFDRSKTCGDKKEPIGLSCAKLHIE